MSEVWKARLDDRYDVVVNRVEPYRGVLEIRIGDALVHHEEVTISYNAVFGPDVDDVRYWREIATKFVDRVKA